MFGRRTLQGPKTQSSAEPVGVLCEGSSAGLSVVQTLPQSPAAETQRFRRILRDGEARARLLGVNGDRLFLLYSQ